MMELPPEVRAKINQIHEEIHSFAGSAAELVEMLEPTMEMDEIAPGVFAGGLEDLPMLMATQIIAREVAGTVELFCKLKAWSDACHASNN